MPVYRRKDSPFYWMALEGTAIRESTLIPVDGGTLTQTATNRRLAQAVYAAKMGDLARRRHRLPLSVERRTFAQQRAWYTEHVTTQKRGKVREASMLKQLGIFYDAYELQAIDHALAREWRTVRLKQVSAATVNREETVLKHLLTTAVPKYLERNPLAGLAGLRVAGTDARILTPDEETRLLDATATPEDQALLLVALDTLLRLTNARTLTRKQDHGAYLFSDTKTDAIKIPVSTRLRTALDALPMAGGFYFPRYAIYGPGPTADMFLATCTRANIPTGRKAGGVSFHCLRHTGASRMLAAGVDVKTVMRIGGWKNLAVIERYLHPTTEAMQAAVNSIGSAVTHTSGLAK